MPNIESEEDFMFNFIKDICEQVGPRPSFSEKELEGARFVEKEFKKYSQDQDTVIEDFTVRAAPFLFDFKLSVIFYIISAFLYLFIPFVSLILMIFILISLLLEQVWNFRILNYLGWTRHSQNVIAKVTPKEECKRIVIIGGHIDSAYELPYVRKFKQKFMIIIAAGLIFILLIIFFSIIKIPLQILSRGLDVFSIVSSVILLIGIGPVFPFFFMVSNRPVEGANDNLSAVAVCLNLLRKYSQNPPDHVELRFIAFGAEESGRYGSTKYAIRHKEELGSSYTINTETIGGTGRFVIIKREVVVPHSMEVVEILSEAAKNTGNPMELYSVPIAGGTDSWSFSKQGLKASSITLLSEKTIPDGWHCREDTPDLIDKHQLKIVSDVCEEFIRLCNQRVAE